jgi:hypothetical protein
MQLDAFVEPSLQPSSPGLESVKSNFFEDDVNYEEVNKNLEIPK